jgi:four helix bundle protein
MTNDGGIQREVRVLAAADFDAFWEEYDAPTSRVREEPESPRLPAFDLEERTALFGEAVISFARRLPHNPVNNRLIDQLVGAATSVGANYCEADDAVSKKEFILNINRCRKESRETKFFLRMVATAEPSCKRDARPLWREAKELNLIFASIVRTARKGMTNPKATKGKSA